jgi:hypothetical protein
MATHHRLSAKPVSERLRLIEFFKAILRLIFCPRMPELRPFNLSDESAKYWNLRLSALSSLIGYGLIVAVPIISNQVNVQVGALATWSSCCALRSGRCI